MSKRKKMQKPNYRAFGERDTTFVRGYAIYRRTQKKAMKKYVPKGPQIIIELNLYNQFDFLKLA